MSDISVTRRTVVLSAVAASAAFGLDKRLEIIPSAHAQTTASPLNPKGLGHVKFKIGDIEVTQLFDGAITRDHNPGFIKNASVDEQKAALRAAGLPDDKMPNAYTITVVKMGGRTVMFDAGSGLGSGNPALGQITENAKAAGVDLQKLTAIVVTHFHPDHIFGLMTKDNAQVYANTEIIVPEAEFKYWADPAVIATLPEARQGIAKRVQATLKDWKNVKPAAKDSEVLPGIKSVATHGHTPGHTSYHMASGNQQLMVLGDITSIPAINLRNPHWHIMFDQDAVEAEATRRRIMDRAIADKITLAGYHWGMPGAGMVAKDGNGYVLQPIAV